MRMLVPQSAGRKFIQITSTLERSFCGDVNKDGVVNIADVVYMVNYLFTNGPAPDPIQAGDVNLDGVVNIADVIYLVNYLFTNGPAPCS